jgi:hypothetical protein
MKMVNIESMSKGEKSLLLYLESRATNHSGLINVSQINKEEIDICNRWNKKGFIQFGRVVARNVRSYCFMWCKLPESTFKIAHKLRKERADRMWLNKNWLSTEESREMHGSPHLSGLNNNEPISDVNKFKKVKINNKEIKKSKNQQKGGII